MSADDSSPAPGFAAGRPVRRVEDERLLRGRGDFVDDGAMPDALHLAFLRSPVARGRLESVDAQAARRMPGVVRVIIGAELAQLPTPAVNALVPGLRVPRLEILAHSHVAAVGQPVAAVLAATPDAALDAVEAIDFRIGSTDDDGADGTECFAQRWQAGDADTAFAAAAHVVRARVEHARLAPLALEPRAACASWDDATGRLTVRLSTQTPHRARENLAEALALDAARIRVVAPDVGGAFGGKASIYPEEIVVAWAALQLRRPVRWCATRGEEMLAATQGRGGVLSGELALDADGRMLALRARLAFPLGAWLPFSATVPARNAARILPGPYAVPVVDIAMRGTTDARAAVGIYRGAGRPEAAMLMERLVEAAARATGIDAVTLRRRNLVAADAMPWRTATGEILDSGDFAALLDRAVAAAVAAGLFAARDRRRLAGGICGVGLALYVEPCGQGWESARLALGPDGMLVAATGCTAQGQGRETAYRQLLAGVLPLPPERVVVRHGDTDAAPPGIGALASRGTAIGGSALTNAAKALLARARALAARRLGVDEAALAVTPDGIAAGQRLAAWREIAADAGGAGLEEIIRYTAPGEAWSSGCCVAALAIDRDTGVPALERLIWIDDAGTVVNPMLVEGQLRGGLAQGLGEALLERVVYDGEGQPLTGSLMDYAVPRARDIPPVELGSIATPSPVNALGAKGVGEAGCIGVPAAILNAALDALAPFGVAALDPPLTPEKLWRAMRDGATMGRERTPP
ncbi:MAG: xanthine dehydrogenase family protein molybdopterin-binding subunit [Alphaproteobacteria bacterium]|nr:xanthine dehydrogenase family protein molybdopterin-binding subunit [Alphaproteobacteria bacterium]